MMCSCAYIYFCGLVLGWLVPFIYNQSDVPFAAENVTDIAWNETDLDNTVYSYEETTINPTNILFGAVNNISQESSTERDTIVLTTTPYASVYFVNINAPTVKVSSLSEDAPRLRISSRRNTTSVRPFTTEEIFPSSTYNSYPLNDSIKSVFPVSYYTLVPPIADRTDSNGDPIFLLKEDMNSARNYTIPIIMPIEEKKKSEQHRTTGIDMLVLPRSTRPPTSPLQTTSVSKTPKTSSTTRRKRKTATSAKKRASLTRRVITKTTTVETKRFRSAALQRINTTPARVWSRSTSSRKSMRSTTPSVRGKRFRQLRRTRTPRRAGVRTSKRRRFRNLRRTKPTLRRTPLIRPRFRKITPQKRFRAPQMMDYDFLYF